MAEDFVKRDEYGKTLERVFEGVNSIKENVAKISGVVERIEITTDKTHDVVYGDGSGREGLTTKISNAFMGIKLNRWLIGLILAGLLTLVFFILRRGV